MEIIECTVDQTIFNMIVTNAWERFRVETLMTKEPETVRWILENFRDGDTLYDVGANIGIYAIFAAALNRRGTVVAVEPMAINFARLCQNAMLNDLRNFRPYCVGIAGANGLATLNVSSFEAASSMHSLGTGDATEQFGASVVMRAGVGVATLDSLALAAGDPDLMKIDVDGGEDDVLAGATRVLRNPQLRSVLIEFNWTASSAGGQDRDGPLRDAGFIAQSRGIQHVRGAMAWQNVIYTRC